MSESGPRPSGTEDLPDVGIKQRSGVSIIWLIPLIAGLIGAWLTYKTISEQGPTVTITFENGDGLEAGKTKIKYKSVVVGNVDTVDISDDLRLVTITARMNKGVEQHLTENTRFWVVRPRVGLGGVSGLETLLSGAYIGVDPRPGSVSTQFVGLETPPGVMALEDGGKYQLRTTSLGSVGTGSPIFFRDIEVGRVLNHAITKDAQGVLIDVFINAPHHLLVRDVSRFWKTSGIQVSVGTDGVDIKMESLATIISGGISFDTPVTASGGSVPSKSGTAFKLFESYENISESLYTHKVPFLLHFNGSVRGLNPGAPVEFRGIKVGSVKDISAKIDETTLAIIIDVAIEIEPQRLANEGTKQQEPYSVMKELVHRGLRAQLETASLVTGQLFVELEFFPDFPKQPLLMTEKYPTIPTAPSSLDEIQNTVSHVMQDIHKLPLNEIAGELLGMLKGANHLTNSPELLTSVRNLNAALSDVRKLTHSLDQTVIDVADVADPSSPTMVNLASMLEELTDAARSIRVFAEYLERHPEAIIRGKK